MPVFLPHLVQKYEVYSNLKGEKYVSTSNPHSSLWLVSLCAVLIIGNIGCSQEDNSQPVIEAIPDIKLNVDAESTVEVNITDADFRDTHSIRASSSDKTIAIVSANPARRVRNSFIATLSISTVSEGVTTITVSATDDSGQDNATTMPVTFQVTVKANSQPVIEALPDVTLTAGTELEVNLNITDADVDDKHRIILNSRDSAIATFGGSGFVGTSLTIYGEAEGMTTVSVYAKDFSEVNNAESTPVTFQVTVEPYVNKGRCAAGMVLEPGESCTYFAQDAEVLFYVKRDLGCRGTETAEGKRSGFCRSPEIERDDFFNTRFAAQKNADESWTVKRIP